MWFFRKTLPVPIHIYPHSMLARIFWISIALATGVGMVKLPLSIAGLMIVVPTLMISSLIEPLFGLAIILLVGPFGALERILGQTILDSGQLLLLITLGVWIARGIARREPFINHPIQFTGAFRTATYFLIAFLGIGGLSLFKAHSLNDGIKELIKWVQIGLVAWIVFDMAGRRGITLVLLAIIPTALVQALTGIWQFGLRGTGPEHFEILDRFYRAYGTFEQPNPFAGFLGLTIPLAAGWGLGNFMDWRENIRRKPGDEEPLPFFSFPVLTKIIFPLSIATVLLLALVMSWSRGGWLGAAGGLSAMVFFIPKRQWKGVLIILILLGITVFLLQTGLMPVSITNRLTGFSSIMNFSDARGVDVTPENYSVLERMAHWQSALRMADANPWIGVGAGNYAAAYHNYELLNWPYPLGHAHNIYLNILAETGILGLLAYAGFWISVAWLTAQVIKTLSYPERGIALGLMGAWVHLTIHHIVDNLYVNNIFLHMGALFGILLFLWHKSIHTNKGNPEKSLIVHELEDTYED